MLGKEDIGSKNVKFQLYHRIQCTAEIYPTKFVHMNEHEENKMKCDEDGLVQNVSSAECGWGVQYEDKHWDDKVKLQKNRKQI